MPIDAEFYALSWPEHTSKLGKALLRKRRARLHEFVETVRSQISSPREVLGWGSVGADQRTCPMDRNKDPARAGSDQRAEALSSLARLR